MTEKVRILTDDIELEPTKDFIKLSDTIVSFIKGSDPKFSVGIFGDWGTGKSTLMKLVENKINENNDRKNGKILTIWFNAWRYEREEELATIALMKTIAYAMAGHPIYNKISESIWNGIKVIGKDWLKQIASNFISDDAITDLGKIKEKLKLLAQFEQETIYFDGLHVIEQETAKILEQNNESRIIVFIDDLDRCSPKKVLEVLESIKIFFDMKGFIFIMGLSDRTIVRVITNHFGNSGVSGEDYIQKIIQLPIRIPLWNPTDIEKIIENKLANKLDDPYREFIKKQQNKEIIAIAVQPNPRELKRFINNLIVAMEAYGDILEKHKIDSKELLIIESLKWRWHEYYLDLISRKEFRDEMIRLVKLEKPQRETELKKLKTEENDINYVANRILSIDDKLWSFLTSGNVKDTFTKITEWEIHRRVAGTKFPRAENIKSAISANYDDLFRQYFESRELSDVPNSDQFKLSDYFAPISADKDERSLERLRWRKPKRDR